VTAEPAIKIMSCRLCGSELEEGYHLEVCELCMGGRSSFELPPTYPAKPAYRGKKTKPDKCSKCGKGTDETDFYASEVYVCKPCHLAKSKANKAKQKKLWTSVKETHTIPVNGPVTTNDTTTLQQHVIQLDFRKCPWALDWFREQFVEKHISVLGIARKVPSEWLKERMLREMSQGTH